jgi:N-acetylmuramoyl-L-alanine amidase
MARRGRSTPTRGAHRSAGTGAGATPGNVHPRPWKIPLIATLAIVAVLAAGAYAVIQLAPQAQSNMLNAGDRSLLPAGSLAASDGVPTTATLDASGTLAATSTIEVELPDVVGKSMLTAETLLQAAGFVTVTRVATQARPGVAPDTIVAQNPSAGTRLKPGDTVMITYNPRSDAAAAAAAGAVQPVVVIDPGHQQTADVTLEPIGPGSATKKEKVKGGATGVDTKIPEYKQTLAISLKLRDSLQASGIKVVMIRTTPNVNIANSQRAIIGNKAGAALVIRVHCDSSGDTAVAGLSTLYPAGNAWTKPIEVASKRAATLVQAATVKATGAKNRGLFPRSDMSGFNYSTVPTIIVECGFMSNAAEDRLIADAGYQDKLAAGMAAGVLGFLGR